MSPLGRRLDWSGHDQTTAWLCTLRRYTRCFGADGYVPQEARHRRTKNRRCTASRAGICHQRCRDRRLAGRPVHIAQIGVMYMYTGAWVQDLHGTSHSEDHTYQVGPHVMIITPHNEALATFSHDGSDGQPYVAHLPGHSELYLVMPYQDLPQQ